ncbi:MAG TPA: hypothetical protein PKO33_09445 [Pyrinomonadaceae bacterium]|nr:hypothetical protein [Pyrinomonadaceae bacterium]
MKIATVVSSDSHLDYLARVVDSLDVAAPPDADDFGFAQFVSMPIDDGPELVGIIYDSTLINPEYSNFGPRLSPKPDLGKFSPDFLNEQGLLLRILILGTRSEDGTDHGVPRRAAPAGQDVFALSADDVMRIHRGPDGRLRIHYYSQLTSHVGPASAPLVEAIIGQLEATAEKADLGRLKVLNETLRWQRTIGGLRL